MSENPFAPSQVAPDVDPPQVSPGIPDDIQKKIKACCIAGLISIALTTLLILISIFGTSVLGLDAWAFIDVAIMAGLTFGVYKKSRICAILLFSFFLLGKIIIWSQSEQLSGVVMAVIFLYYFGQGIVGTFQYHKFKQSTGSQEVFA